MSETCTTCRGTGTIRVKHGTTYITDDADEIELAFHEEKCPECKGISPVERAAFLRGARAAKAQIINALAMATWIHIEPAIFNAIGALPDPEY